MNFVLLPWLRAPQPAGFPVALIAFLFWALPVLRADGVKPVCNGSAKNSAQAEALATPVQRPCMDVATARCVAAKEGQSLCIGQPVRRQRLAYETRLAERIVANDADGAARCSFLPAGSFGVNNAGAAWGGGAGAPTLSRAGSSAGRTHAWTAYSRVESAKIMSPVFIPARNSAAQLNNADAPAAAVSSAAAVERFAA